METNKPHRSLSLPNGIWSRFLGIEEIILACTDENFWLSFSFSSSIGLLKHVWVSVKLLKLHKFVAHKMLENFLFFLMDHYCHQTSGKKPCWTIWTFSIIINGHISSFQWRLLDVHRVIPQCSHAHSIMLLILNFQESHPWQSGYVLVWSYWRSILVPGCCLNVAKMCRLSPVSPPSHAPGLGPVKY